MKFPHGRPVPSRNAAGLTRASSTRWWMSNGLLRRVPFITDARETRVSALARTAPAALWKPADLVWFARKCVLTSQVGPPVHDDHGQAGFYPAPNEGKLYLCAIKDVDLNPAGCHSSDSRMKDSLAVSVLHNAVALRDPEGPVVHSDPGCQFHSNAVVRTLKGKGSPVLWGGLARLSCR